MKLPNIFFTNSIGLRSVKKKLIENTAFVIPIREFLYGDNHFGGWSVLLTAGQQSENNWRKSEDFEEMETLVPIFDLKLRCKVNSRTSNFSE